MSETTVKKRNAAVVEEIGERLRQLRERKKLTRAELAKECGLHYDTVLKVEMNQRRVNLGTLADMASALGTDLGKLLRYADA